MPRPRNPDPSPEALYRRKLRESKMTPTELARLQNLHHFLDTQRQDPDIQRHRHHERCLRRRDVRRAWVMWNTPEKDRLYDKDGMYIRNFRGYTMTWEEAHKILRGGNGYPNLIANLQLGQPKPPGRGAGVPKKKTYLGKDGLPDPTKVNDILHKLAKIHGVNPASPCLMPSEVEEDTFSINHPKNFRFDKILCPPTKRAKRKSSEKVEGPKPPRKVPFRLPKAQQEGFSYVMDDAPAPEEDPALARLRALAAAQKSLEEEPSDDIFGDWQDK